MKLSKHLVEKPWGRIGGDGFIVPDAGRHGWFRLQDNFWSKAKPRLGLFVGSRQQPN